MSYQDYPPPGYGSIYPPPQQQAPPPGHPSAPPQYQYPSSPGGYTYPPPPPGHPSAPPYSSSPGGYTYPPQPHHPPYQGYLAPNYPPSQQPYCHCEHDDRDDCSSFFRGCLAALCFCCVLEECFG